MSIAGLHARYVAWLGRASISGLATRRASRVVKGSALLLPPAAPGSMGDEAMVMTALGGISTSW